MAGDKNDETETDVQRDDAVAGSRPTGGANDAKGPGTRGTTGSAEHGEFVGRISGDDSGYEEETGAEIRARAQRREAP